MKPIFLCKPGAFDAQGKRQIRDAGYCVVETNDFDAFKVVDATIAPPMNVVFKCAMYAIANAGSGGNEGPKTLFGKKLAEELAKP